MRKLLSSEGLEEITWYSLAKIGQIVQATYTRSEHLIV
jgi:hypothetical protein